MNSAMCFLFHHFDCALVNKCFLTSLGAVVLQSKKSTVHHEEYPTLASVYPRPLARSIPLPQVHGPYSSSSFSKHHVHLQPMFLPYTTQPGERWRNGPARAPTPRSQPWRKHPKTLLSSFPTSQPPPSLPSAFGPGITPSNSRLPKPGQHHAHASQRLS